MGVQPNYILSKMHKTNTQKLRNTSTLIKIIIYKIKIVIFIFMYFCK